MCAWEPHLHDTLKDPTHIRSLKTEKESVAYVTY